jgi:hypothetical protein
VQDLLYVLQDADHGRGTEHDFAVPYSDQIQECGGEEEVWCFVSAPRPISSNFSILLERAASNDEEAFACMEEGISNER